MIQYTQKHVHMSVTNMYIDIYVVTYVCICIFCWVHVQKFKWLCSFEATYVLKQVGTYAMMYFYYAL